MSETGSVGFTDIGNSEDQCGFVYFGIDVVDPALLGNIVCNVRFTTDRRQITVPTVLSIATAGYKYGYVPMYWRVNSGATPIQVAFTITGITGTVEYDYFATLRPGQN